MNSVNLIGRLVKDTEANTTGKVAMNTIAVDSEFKDQNGNKQTDFINVRWLGEQRANFAMQYLKKGIKIGVTGSLTVKNYTDKNGDKKSITYVTVDKTAFCEKKSEQDNQSSFDSFNKPSQTSPNNFEFELPPQTPSSPFNAHFQDENDNLPF